jgi:hypothetical protein
MDKTSEKYIPMRSPGIANPGTIAAAKSIIAPLITNENSPSVTAFIGSVTSIATGLMV